MPLSPNTAPVERTPVSESGVPILEVLDHAAPSALFAKACQVCQGKHWFYGHGSNAGDGSSFWKMELEGNAVFDAIWEHVKPACEALAGAPLRVIRQYANGHTYGLGGRPHVDDRRPGTFTFLYYPMPEWKDEWDGETLYFDDAGEIALAVKLRPNRGVFFDSRILHVGRPPSRACPALRVTVAYKLEVVPPRGGVSFGLGGPTKLAKAPVPMAKPADSSVEPAAVEQIRSDGARRMYRFTIPAAAIEPLVRERLTVLAKTVKLPGFRGGSIPDELMRKRYGAEARRDALNRLSSAAIDRALPKGTVLAKVEVQGGGEAGDAEIQVTGTYLPALPDPDFSAMALDRLTVPDGLADAVGLTASAAQAILRAGLRAQVLDRLDAAYRIPVLPALVEREFALIWKAAETSDLLPSTRMDPKAQSARREEFRRIAERRVRLGWVVAELARRFDIRAREGAELEERVIERIVSLAPAAEREATEAELRELAEG